MLSTVSDPARGRQTLQEVAQLMEANAALSEVLAAAEIAQKCRAAAQTTADPQVLGVCRQIATGLARTASSLATEIQQSTGAPSRTELKAPPKSQPGPSPEPPKTPAPTASPPTQDKLAPQPSPAPPHPTPAPAAQTASAPPPKPAPQSAPAPTGEKARPAAVPIDRVTTARTAAEKEAVTRALQDAKRFAPIANGTFIDTRHNRMWTARVVPAASHAAARRLAGDCRAGQYSDWRLPQPAELQELLAGQAREPLRSAGVFQPEDGGNPAEWLWSSEVKSRFLGLLKQAIACQISTASTVPLKPATANVHSILVRP